MGTYSYPNLKVVLRRYYLGENYLWQGDWGFPPTSGRLVYQMPCLLVLSGAFAVNRESLLMIEKSDALTVARASDNSQISNRLDHA